MKTVALLLEVKHGSTVVCRLVNRDRVDRQMEIHSEESEMADLVKPSRSEE